jgi:hypothetical protein
VNPPPTATCSFSATQGVAITPVTPAASGGLGAPYTFSATGLPAGLTMSSGGAISGAPTASGTFNYTLTVKDSAGNQGTANCSVTVTTGAASQPVLYLRAGATQSVTGGLSLTPGTGVSSDTVPAGNGVTHDGTPTNPITYKITGLNGTYNGGATSFKLYLDSGTAVANGIQLEVLYDFTGDGTADRTEIYHYFATDNRVGWELYNESAGSESSSGAFGNMANGTVTIKLWNAIGTHVAMVNASATAAEGSQSAVTIPFSGLH